MLLKQAKCLHADIYYYSEHILDGKYNILSNTYKEFTISSFWSHFSKYLCFNRTDIFSPHSNSMRPVIILIISILQIKLKSGGIK